MDNFIKIPYNSKNLDKYLVRTSILSNIKANCHLFKGKLLDIGCGKMPYRNLVKEKSKIREYIGIDLENALIYNENVKPDYTWDGEKLPFKNNEFETVLMIEVLEHVPKPEVTIKEAFRVLEEGGLIFFTVPFLWPLHEIPKDEYRYTPFALHRILKLSGFKEIEIHATGGWDASLAQMLGLWVRRRKMSNLKRKCLSIFFMPIIKYLISKDKKPIYFIESQMITGLYGFAKKSNS
jgi:SAM-dependent methyltransferase